MDTYNFMQQGRWYTIVDLMKKRFKAIDDTVRYLIWNTLDKELKITKD